MLNVINDLMAESGSGCDGVCLSAKARSGNCRTSDRQACLYPESITRGRRIPFSRRGFRPSGRAEIASKHPRSCKRRSPSPRSKKPEGLETKTKETDIQTGPTGSGDAAPRPRPGGKGAKEKKGPGGRRKPSKGLIGRRKSKDFLGSILAGPCCMRPGFGSVWIPLGGIDS